MTATSEEAFEKMVSILPLAAYGAGETILTAGSKTGRLLVLKSGAVVVLKDSIEIARVDQPGAIIGEISALLDLPHTADVRALSDSQFHVADAALVGKDPVASLYIARMLARRSVEANKNFVELKNQIMAGQPSNGLNKMLKRLEQILSVGGASFET
jgi:CRP-like cAMP-binding protein